MSKRPKRTANPERGEHEVVLLGKAYKLRPSYAAQVAIERQTRPYLELARAAQAGAIPAQEAAVAVAELINAGADSEMDMVSVERVGEMIYETGLPQIAARLAVVFIDALSGGRTASGEVRAGAARPTKAATSAD